MNIFLEKKCYYRAGISLRELRIEKLIVKKSRH